MWGESTLAREKRLCKGIKVEGLGMELRGLSMFKNRQKASMATICMSLRSTILAKGWGQDTNQTTTSWLFGTVSCWREAGKWVGAGEVSRFKWESDSCDLVRLFLLERVDKNDQHKLPCEGPVPPALRPPLDLHGRVTATLVITALTARAPPNPGALPLHAA